MTKSTTSDSDSRESTPSPAPTPKKKKSSKKNELKWFKGSSNKTRTPKKLLKHAQRESSPQQLPIPARVVEFDVEGHTERLGVSEVLSIIDKGNANYDLPQTPDMADDSSNSAFPNSPFPTTSLASTSKAGKGKGALKRPNKNRVSATPKITTNPNNNWNISENSESNSVPTKLPEGKFSIMDDYNPRLASPVPNSYIRYMEKRPDELENEVEYDMDEEDIAWLELVNDKRREDKLHPVMPEDMELLLDRLEKESYFQMQSTGMEQAPLIDDDAVCCICMDGECENSNAILFCDMCNLAVHQECYGVPYIPEGQWLCRRCLQSPSRAVDCALCPNKGGAFKQTDDGRWAHVICAIWIPEVCFANTVFLEPIDSVNNIPAARWRLYCFICKQKGVGACIQCQKTNCYTAFHVTCAQQANLCMKMDTVVEGNAVIVKKTAYCDHHAPPENDRDDDSPRQKLKQTRKLLAEKRCAIPIVSIPTIPNDRINEIAKDVHFLRKHQFIKRLMAYWKLKRQQRNGVPLLRRLQAASTSSVKSTISNRAENRSTGSTEFTTTLNYYHYWVRMRQDLEKARLLCELIRKRERLKRTYIHTKHQEVNLTLKPFNSILLNVVDELMARDVTEIFCEPVDTNEVVDYLNVIKKPMDLSTIKEKVNSFEYSSIDELEKDFDLMVHNCLIYNGKDTIYYKAGLRLRELGGVVIRSARRLINSIGFDKVTGLHLENRVSELPVLEDNEIIEKVENFMESEERFKLPFETHIEELQNLMDETLALSHPLKRKNRFAKVRCELFRLRKLKNYKADPATCFKDYVDSKHNSLYMTCTDPTSLPMLNCDPAIEPFRVGVSPAKRVENVSAQDSANTTAHETRSPTIQRSKIRSLRPLKRKILTESPLKDSPSKESPTKDTTPKPKAGIRDSKSLTNLKISKNSRRGSISPTRKSQRISSAQDMQLQIELPVTSTPTKSSVSPANRSTTTPQSNRKGSMPEVISPVQDNDNADELPKRKKKRNSSSEAPPSPEPEPEFEPDNNSLDTGENNYDDYDNDGDFLNDRSVRADVISRSPSPAASVASKSSSGSSISSLIRFDAPDIRFDRIGAPHEPGTIPIHVSPTRPIEVITNYSSDNSSPLSLPDKVLMLRKGSYVYVHKSTRRLFADESTDLDFSADDSDLATPNQSFASGSTTINAEFRSPSIPPKKVETPNSASSKSSQFRTPELQKERPSKYKKKLSSVNVTPTSSTTSSKRRVISFTAPSPLKPSPEKSNRKKSKIDKKDKEKQESFAKLVNSCKKADVNLTNLTPVKAHKGSPKASSTAKTSSPKKGRDSFQTPPPRRASPFMASTGKSVKPIRSPSKLNTPKKSGTTNRDGSTTKSSPKTLNNKIPQKRLSVSDISSTKQKKAKLLTPGKARLSRSLSQSEFRAQSRSPSITSLAVREPAGGNKNRPTVNNVKVKPKAQEKPAANANTSPSVANANTSSFSAYRGIRPNEMDSNSDEDDNVRNAADEDQGDDGKSQDSEDDRSESVKEIDAQNGTFAHEYESLASPGNDGKKKPLKDIVERTESFTSETLLSIVPVNNSRTSTTTATSRPPPILGSEVNVLNNLNTNEKVSAPRSPSPASPESDLSDVLEMSDEEEDSLVNNKIFARYEDFKPQPLELVWAVYEFKSWFPAMVINPDGPFGISHNGYKVHQPPPEVFTKKPNIDPVFLVEYFELKHHWKWVEGNQVKPLGSDIEVDNFLLAAKSMLDLKEVRKAYERAILHRCRGVKPEDEKPRIAHMPLAFLPDEEPIGELLDIN